MNISVSQRPHTDSTKISRAPTVRSGRKWATNRVLDTCLLHSKMRDCYTENGAGEFLSGGESMVICSCHSNEHHIYDRGWVGFLRIWGHQKVQPPKEKLGTKSALFPPNSLLVFFAVHGRQTTATFIAKRGLQECPRLISGCGWARVKFGCNFRALLQIVQS